MATKNDITGDEIKSKALSKQGKENWDRIFNKNQCTYPKCHCPFDMYSGERCMAGKGVVK